MAFCGLTFFLLTLFYLVTVYSRPTGKRSYLKHANIQLSCIRISITGHSVPAWHVDKEYFLFGQPDVF